MPMCGQSKQGGLSWIMTSLVWVSRRKKKAFRISPTEPLHLQCFRNFQRLKHRWERLTKTHKSVSFYFRQRESSKQLSFIFNRCPARNPLKISKTHFFLRHPVVTRVSTVEHLLSAFNPTNLENWVNHLLELSFQYSISTN